MEATPENYDLKVSFAERQFVNVDALGSVVQETVLPIAAVVRGKYHHLGTGFVVSGCGLLVTARHVVEHLASKFATQAVTPDRTIDCEEEFGLVALYCKEREEDSEGPLFGGLLPVSRYTYSHASDLALVSLRLPIIDGKALDLPSMPLCPTIPELGEETVAFGYSLMRSEGSLETALRWQQSFHASRGKVQEVHALQRDNTMINFPSFRSDARYDFGMSGGPLLGCHRSGVIGVVSSAMEPLEASDPWTSYGALLEPLMNLEAPIRVDGTSMVLTVREMATRGIICLR